MKPFEERYTQWIDGQLTGAELETFERELPDVAAAELDRAQALRLGSFLREHAAPGMLNAEFFSHQLLERIAADEAAARPSRPAAGKKREWSFFSLPNLAWGAACCVLLSTTVYLATMSPASKRPPGFAATDISKGQISAPIAAVQVPAPAAPHTGSTAYTASIIEATAMEPGVSASVYAQEDNVTVLWLDGLDYLPASYTLQ